MEFETVRFTVDDRIARITLDRPSDANALNLTMARELSKIAITCDEDPDIRAVVITGAGRFFCAGGDLAAFAASGDDVGALIGEMTM